METQETKTRTNVSHKIDEAHLIEIEVSPEDELMAKRALKTLDEIDYVGGFNTIYDPEKQNNAYYNTFYQNLNTQNLAKIDFFINQTNPSEKKEYIWKILFSPLTKYKVDNIIEEAIQKFYGADTKSEEDQRWFLESLSMISGLHSHKNSYNTPETTNKIVSEYIKLINNFHIEKALEKVDIKDKQKAKEYFHEAQKHIAQFFKSGLETGTKNDINLVLAVYQNFQNHILVYEDYSLNTSLLEHQLKTLKQSLHSILKESGAKDVQGITEKTKGNIAQFSRTK